VDVPVLLSLLVPFEEELVDWTKEHVFTVLSLFSAGGAVRTAAVTAADAACFSGEASII